MARRGIDLKLDATEVIATLEGLARDVPICTRDALRETAKIIRSAARERVPVKHGYLKRGIRFRVPDEETAVIVASSESSGINREYASIVHEDLEANHKHGGQAKYLEEPLREFGGTTLRQKASHALKKAYAKEVDITPPPDIDE